MIIPCRVSLALSLLAVLLGLETSSVWATEPIRFARTPDISPDGKLVAFSYLGDIWVVETIGGVARPVTMHEAHDVNPVFSPDGRWIAFSLQSPRQLRRLRRAGPRRPADAADLRLRRRHASPAGRPTASTSCSPRRAAPISRRATSCTPCPSRAAGRSASAPAEGREGVFSPKGDQHRLRPRPRHLVSQGLSRLVQRRHLDLQGRRHRQPPPDRLQRPGQLADVERRRPVPLLRQRISSAPRPTSSEPGRRLGKTQAASSITFHKDDGVRRARISGNGEWIVYECGPDLWVVSTQGRHPAQAGHRGQRRRQDQHRADRHLHHAASPNLPCRRMRSTSPSSSTARCS